MLDGINKRFAVDDQLRFVQHPSGLVQGEISTESCRGLFFLHGAHVANFQPTGQQPLLFMSDQSAYSSDKPIRGGVPLCFPWFGPHPTDGSAPAHGLVRTQAWDLKSTSHDATGEISVALGLIVDQWRLTYAIQFGSSLKLTLAIENLASSERECEVALHSYLELADVHTASVNGLEHQPYLDKLVQQQVEPSGSAIRFTQETDRVYHGPVPEVIVRDPGHHRRIVIKPKNSHSTVVWNPWVDKSQRMPDFGDQEYLRMCCVETANVGDARLRLAGESSDEMGVEFSIVEE